MDSLENAVNTRRDEGRRDLSERDNEFLTDMAAWIHKAEAALAADLGDPDFAPVEVDRDLVEL